MLRHFYGTVNIFFVKIMTYLTRKITRTCSTNFEERYTAAPPDDVIVLNGSRQRISLQQNESTEG
jgi:hypothetical protein